MLADADPADPDAYQFVVGEDVHAAHRCDDCDQVFLMSHAMAGHQRRAAGCSPDE